MTEEVERDNAMEYSLTERSLIGEMGLDSLTGVLNWHAARARITDQLSENGALLICDIDHFKRINERFGHRAGDECLQLAAQTLGRLIGDRDILGRSGGDEFVIYMPECQGEKLAKQALERLTDRFAAYQKRRAGEISLTVTAGCAVCGEEDTCETMFARARKDLFEKRRGAAGGGGEEAAGADSYRRDAGRIREDLMEEISTPGAYCRDYETFKSIYRFLERGIIRNGQKACVILMTVVDDDGRSVAPDEKDFLMELLGEAIRTTLRIGDVYTRYTSSQYLVLAIDTSQKLADMIADRVKEKFLSDSGRKNLLVHCCYELQPARYRR